MAQTPPTSLPARPTHIAIVGSYLGRARFGAALSHLAQIKVVGVVDADLRAARGWARELPAKPPVYSTLDKLLEAQQDLGGVVVAGELADRAAVVGSLASVGISVLTEFPYTKSLVEMDRLAGTAEASRSLIVPAFTHRYDPAALELDDVLANNSVGDIIRVRSEVSFPLSASFALENGLVPRSIDWYDLLQVIALRTVDLCVRWLGKPESVNADIDLPHHAALVGRRAADPVANLIISHESGQSTHLLKLSRSVSPTERYLLYGNLGSIELVKCDGEKLAAGPTVRLHVNGSKPETIYASESCASDYNIASTNMLSEFDRSILSGSPAADVTIDARIALETVQAAFASARDGIRTALPLSEAVDVDGILEGSG